MVDAGGDLLGGVKHVLKHNATAGLVDADWERASGLNNGFDDLLLVGTIGISRFVSTCKLPHESISAVIVEVHAGNISVVESASAASTLVVITTASAVEGTTRASGMGTTATGTGES